MVSASYPNRAHHHRLVQKDKVSPSNDDCALYRLFFPLCSQQVLYVLTESDTDGSLPQFTFLLYRVCSTSTKHVSWHRPEKRSYYIYWRAQPQPPALLLAPTRKQIPTAYRIILSYGNLLHLRRSLWLQAIGWYQVRHHYQPLYRNFSNCGTPLPYRQPREFRIRASL